MSEIDVVTIGSATMDVFVESDEANIVSVCSKNKNSDFMSYPYGSKIDMTSFATNIGGGGLNTAMNLANLGLKTSAIFKVGNDIYSAGIFDALKKTNVDLSGVVQNPEVSTGFSIILVSFQADRTVLAHRGANSLININDINFDLIKKARLLYIAPLNGESNKVLEPLVKFAHEHGVKVCFNAGTTSLKKGFEEIKKLLEVANIVVMNREEASMCSGIVVRPDTKTEKFSQELIHPDVKKMLEKLKVQEYQVIVITDGSKGAYAFDGMKYYYCPTYPSPVVSTLGAGDAFASTFCAALGRTKLNIGKALMYASVNSAAVVSVFGASEGFLNFEQIEAKLGASPDYTYLLA